MKRTQTRWNLPLFYFCLSAVNTWLFLRPPNEFEVFYFLHSASYPSISTVVLFRFFFFFYELFDFALHSSAGHCFSIEPLSVFPTNVCPTSWNVYNNKIELRFSFFFLFSFFPFSFLSWSFVLKILKPFLMKSKIFPPASVSSFLWLWE